MDLAHGARRLLAMMRHTAADGSPNIVGECLGVIDGAACVDLIVTDLAVISVSPDSSGSGDSRDSREGLVLTEVDGRPNGCWV